MGHFSEDGCNALNCRKEVSIYCAQCNCFYCAEDAILEHATKNRMHIFQEYNLREDVLKLNNL